MMTPHVLEDWNPIFLLPVNKMNELNLIVIS
jgi:hypothetical protein